jgi:hypothetical protein
MSNTTPKNHKPHKAPPAPHLHDKQTPDEELIFNFQCDDSGPASDGAQRDYTFGQLLTRLKCRKPIRNGKVNFFDESRLRTECARRYATDITYESVVGLRDALGRTQAIPPTMIDALDAQAVIDRICDLKRLSPEATAQELMRPGGPSFWQSAAAHNQYLIDYIQIGMDVWQPVSRADCLIVDGKRPTLCPDADPVMPVAFLPAVESCFHDLELLQPEQTIHWVGVRAYARNRCRCFETKPAPEADSYFRGRLRFDDATHTVYLDGTPIKVEHVPTYNAFHFIAKGQGQLLKTEDIQTNVKACSGRLDVQLKHHLPAELYRILKSKRGYGGGFAIDFSKKCAKKRNRRASNR